MSKVQKILVAVLAVLIILCVGVVSYYIGTVNAVWSPETQRTNTVKPQVSQDLTAQYSDKASETPITTLGPATAPDFLDNPENLHDLNLLLDNYNFQEYLDRVNNYMASSNPATTDNAFKLKSLLTQITDALKNCSIKHDEFNDSYTIFYNGVTDIGKSVNIVPTIEDRMLFFAVGFKRPDWLFFDSIEIKPSDGENISKYFDSWDIERDVLNGGVLEYVDTSFFDAELSQMLNSSDLTIRFINNDNDKYYQHEFSDDELNACKELITINQAINGLVDLTFYKKTA